MGAMKGGVDLRARKYRSILLEMRARVIEVMRGAAWNGPSCGTNKKPALPSMHNAESQVCKLQDLYLHCPD